MVQTRFDQYSCVCLFVCLFVFLSFFLSFLFIYSLGFTDKRFDVIWHPVLFQTNTFVVSDIGTSTRFRILLLLFSLAQGSSSLPPTTATQVQSRTCTWAEIGWSQFDSEGFSPRVLFAQKSTFAPKAVSWWRASSSGDWVTTPNAATQELRALRCSLFRSPLIATFFLFQVKEANLDIIMDKMRQDSSEQVSVLVAFHRLFAQSSFQSFFIDLILLCLVISLGLMFSLSSHEVSRLVH